MIIRKANSADAKSLSILGRKTFQATFAKDNTKEDMEAYLDVTYNEPRQRAEISDPNRRIEIAWIGKEAVGFLHLLIGTPEPCVTGPNPIELLRIYVDTSWHGKDVGKALMNRAIEIAASEGYQTIWLGVSNKNFRAQAFYRKFGFKEVGVHIFQLGSKRQWDLVMSRHQERIL